MMMILFRLSFCHLANKRVHKNEAWGVSFTFLLRSISPEFYGSKRQHSRINISQKLPCHGTLSKVMFINKHEASCMSFTFISTRIKIKYNYNIIHINTEFVEKCKSFHHLWRGDATLWAELANCRHENFGSPISRLDKNLFCDNLDKNCAKAIFLFFDVI